MVREWGTLPSSPNHYSAKCNRQALGFIPELGFFDIHVLEFAGVEDVAALKALHKLGILVAGHDLHARMLAFHHVFLLGGTRRRDWCHKPGLLTPRPDSAETKCRKLAVFLVRMKRLSSAFGGSPTRWGSSNVTIVRHMAGAS